MLGNRPVAMYARARAALPLPARHIGVRAMAGAEGSDARATAVSAAAANPDQAEDRFRRESHERGAAPSRAALRVSLRWAAGTSVGVAPRLAARGTTTHRDVTQGLARRRPDHCQRSRRGMVAEVEGKLQAGAARGPASDGSLRGDRVLRDLPVDRDVREESVTHPGAIIENSIACGGELAWIVACAGSHIIIPVVATQRGAAK